MWENDIQMSPKITSKLRKHLRLSEVSLTVAYFLKQTQNIPV